jgi:hypothetical protein
MYSRRAESLSVSPRTRQLAKLSNLSKVLLAATVVLVILTGAVTWLTAVLTSRG